MRKFKMLFAPLLLGALSGCFTVGETPVPPLQVAALPSCVSNCTIAVTGFTAVMTDYCVINSYQTGYSTGWGWGPRGWGPGYTTVSTTSFVPQAHATDRFLVQARDAFEAAGFNVFANPADYVVEVRFTGPDADGDGWRFLGTVCSIFTYESAAATWHAQVKVRDNHTGKLVFAKILDQTYEVGCFSPIPFFGIAGYRRTDPGFMQTWCLTALTHRAVAEAAAFLTGR